jgi:hypothetical protein
MKNINKTQIIGIGIVIVALTTSILTESTLISTTSGVLTAIGVGFIFKWIPFKKQKA